jgi:PadR family transcriptional regulator PadR
MKGYLSFLVLWIISKKSRTGAEISEELAKRKGTKPSPGTIYPVLKELTKKGLIKPDKEKRYTLTSEGRKELNSACNLFCNIFHDMKEMMSSCRMCSK